MRTIAIVLCDNDFGATFMPLLDSVAQVIAYRGKPTREHITNAIREGIAYHYLAFQSREFQTAEQKARSISYLQKNIQVLFDEEAEIFVGKMDHDHGSWWLDVRTGAVNPF